MDPSKAVSDLDNGSRPVVVLGVTGGIAAYKSVILLRQLRKLGIEVHVVPTPAALSMVGKVTWEAISGNSVNVYTDDGADRVTHVAYGQRADLIVIAPATANSIAKIRFGIADNLLLNTVLAARCPVLLAPAMHTEMWQNPATQENIAILKARGFHFVGPENGQLTGADSGIGRMSEPDRILNSVMDLLQHAKCRLSAAAKQLLGKNILISGGGTHEPIDPVRYIANKSTGKMAVALAHEFLRLGAQVTLVSANITDENLSALQYCGKQSELKIVKVTTALELAEKMEQLAPNADALIMAAAVSDYRVASAQSVKLKRSDALQELVLVPNPDILKHLVDTRNARKAQVICGFAAETGSPEKTYLEYGKEKARRKGADLLAINQVGQELGFGDVQTELSFVDRDGKILAAASGSKLEVAKAFAAFISEQVLALESS